MQGGVRSGTTIDPLNEAQRQPLSCLRRELQISETWDSQFSQIGNMAVIVAKVDMPLVYTLTERDVEVQVLSCRRKAKSRLGPRPRGMAGV